MGKRLARLATALMSSLVLVTAAIADDFYEGKTIRIVVGFSAGGGFDTYARAIARQMGKHIPGEPAIVVENMTGAGSLIALKDSDFLADAKKSRLNVDPVGPEAIEKDIANLFKLDPSLISKFKDILYNN